MEYLLLFYSNMYVFGVCKCVYAHICINIQYISVFNVKCVSDFNGED